MKDDTVKLPLAAEADATERPLSIAIVAMGGQGGGVLTGWIVDLAERQGWIAQSTSVPGVAQRTGATIYYVEMMKPGEDGRKPVLAQMPTPGDVDVVIAAEYMEAGRSILRGIVTPERTTLIASNHRALSTIEKMAPGEGIADSGAVSEAIGVVAKRQIVFDMNRLAVENGSVISSALFGSLAASRALPFSVEDYRLVINASGKGVAASLRAFDAAHARTEAGETGGGDTTGDLDALSPLAPPATLPDARANALLQRLRSELPKPARHMAFLGLRKVVNFQDAAYGGEYLDILRDIAAQDLDAGGAANGFRFTETAAKYLANAMAYDDVIRVADLKTRAARRARIAEDMNLGKGQILSTTEFMHPRLEELASTIPAGLARWLHGKPRLYAWLDRRIDKGRRVRTYSLRGFLLLYMMAGLKPLRRRSLRHINEVEHRTAWLSEATKALSHNYDLAVAILSVRRLIKGYSDTHDRAHSKFDRVMQMIRTISHRDDAAEWADRLLRSALKDGNGDDLDGTIQTIRSFTEETQGPT
jgi:indolepyruvate ferredoxin oxidoreductase beta subunit